MVQKAVGSSPITRPIHTVGHPTGFLNALTMMDLNGYASGIPRHFVRTHPEQNKSRLLAPYFICYNSLMFAFYLLSWWYGAGWLAQWKKVGQKTENIGRAFSGKTLLKTLFSPWKRIVTLNNQNATFQQKIRAFEDNLVSRAVGFCVRLLTLLAAFVSLIAVAVIFTTWALVWPLLPPLSILALFKGIGIL